MTKQEIDLYHKKLKEMNQHRKKYPLLYTNDDNIHVKHDEVMVDNNYIKGVMMNKTGKTYSIKIYVDCLFDDIITNILDVVTNSQEEANRIYKQYCDIVDGSDLIQLLNFASFGETL